MTADDDFDPDLIERQFAGEATAEEAERLERWMAADPARRELVAALRRVWESHQSLPRTWDVDAMWGQLTERVETEERRHARAARPRLVRAPLDTFGTRLGTRWHPRVALPIAAAAVLLVALLGAWQTIASRRGQRPALPMREFVTARGERAEVTLTDATHVLLGPATTLRIPADFGATDREIFLDGEAFFQVTHDPRKPFDVHAGSAVARDIGTKFTVSAYHDMTAVQVVVAEGSVAVQRDSVAAAPRTLLNRGDLARLTRTGETAVTRGVNLDRYLGWTTGRLVFEDVPLREAIPRLQRWYDLTITLGDSAMGERHLTASFSGQPVAQVLNALALLLQARVERHGNAVTLSGLHSE